MRPLISKKLELRFKEVGSQENSNDPIIIAKLFNPVGSGTWFLTEYNETTKIAFGYVTGLAHDEWGYVCIQELEAIELPYGLFIERDLFFVEQLFSSLDI